MKRILSIMVAVAAAAMLPLAAQESINSTVEVERVYRGRLADVTKMPIGMEINDTLSNFKLKLDYPTFERPYKDLYEFSSLWAADLEPAGKPRYPWLYVKAGIAYPWMPDADVYISPNLGGKFSFTVYYNHDSFWGDMPVLSVSPEGTSASAASARGNRMVNRAGADIGYRWKKGEIKADVGYSNNYYAYYGSFLSAPDYTALHTGAHDFTLLEASVGARSTVTDRNTFYYDVSLGYTYFDDDRYGDVFAGNGVREHSADVDLSFGATIKRRHKVYLRFVNSVSFYESRSSAPASYNSGFWEATPTYRWESGRWHINAGVSVSSTYGSDAAHKPYSKAVFYPNVKASLEAVKNYLWIDLEAYGRNDVISHADMGRMNPWFDGNIHTLSTAVPIAAGVDIRGVIRDKFSYMLSAAYERVGGMIAFRNVGGLQLPLQHDGDVVSAELELRWKSKDIKAFAGVSYHYYSNAESALMKPSVEVSAMAEYNIRRRVFFRIDCYYRNSVTGIYSDAAEGSQVRSRIPGFVDLGARVSYVINERVAVYIEGDNLINSRIQYFLGYLEPGLSIGGGVYLKF